MKIGNSFKGGKMKNKILVCLMLLLISALISMQVKGQSLFAQNMYKNAKEYYDQGDYKEAIEKLEKVIASAPDWEDALNLLALSYIYSGEPEKAEKSIEALEAQNSSYVPDLKIASAKAYQQKGDMGKAKEKFSGASNVIDKMSDEREKHKAKFQKYYAEKSAELKKKSSPYKSPKSFGKIVNSQWGDYMPQADVTGRRVYFTSKRKGGISEEGPDKDEGDEDLYYTDRQDNGSWGKPVLLPEPLNSRNHEGACAFSADGQIMVYTACGRADGQGSCDLYISYLNGDQWSTPVNMGNLVNTENWDSQPTISPDGSTIIFASNRPDNYGAEDLFMIRKNRFGDWGVPVNLGSTVNTPFSDFAPFIAADGKTLYFASDGHPGFGETDIFKTTLENGEWTEPINMGQPLNTDKDDQYFTIGGDGSIAYFASTRESGNLDLFEIEVPENLRPKPTVIVSGIVKNAKSGVPVGAWVLVEDLETGELIATQKSNSKTGKYLVVLPAGRNYSVSANSEGFFFYSQQFDVEQNAKFREIKKDIPLEPIEKGARVVLNNIFFETGKADLKPESYIELNKAFNLLKANPRMKVEIGGHTDNVGSEDANMKLSHARAKAVMDYLLKAGISSNRLQAKGYGETNPIATNDTEEGRAQNRRTEFVVIEN